ncbi:MAG: trypsin-like peptidase domain-containing protein [Planctomycetaceae bacterium]|nr:trypsin-like peptidase domain-containing protein [Planctomycetaceae bacterium]
MKLRSTLLAILWTALVGVAFAEDVSKPDENAPDANSPSPFYLEDDVQFFPPGPEFPLTGGEPGLTLAENSVLPPAPVEAPTYQAHIQIYQVPQMHWLQWLQAAGESRLIFDGKNAATSVLSESTGKALREFLLRNLDTKVIAEPVLVSRVGVAAVFESGGELEGGVAASGYRAEITVTQADSGKLRLHGSVSLNTSTLNDGEAASEKSFIGFDVQASDGDVVAMAMKLQKDSDVRTIVLLSVQRQTEFPGPGVVSNSPVSAAPFAPLHGESPTADANPFVTEPGAARQMQPVQSSTVRYYNSTIECLYITKEHLENVWEKARTLKAGVAISLEEKAGLRLKASMLSFEGSKMLEHTRVSVLEGRRATFRSNEADLSDDSKYVVRIDLTTSRGEENQINVNGLASAVIHNGNNESQPEEGVSEHEFFVKHSIGDYIVVILETPQESNHRFVLFIDVREATAVTTGGAPPPVVRNDRPFPAIATGPPADPFAPPQVDDAFQPAPNATKDESRQGGTTLIPNHRPGDGGNPQLLDPSVAQPQQPATQTIPSVTFPEESVLSEVPRPTTSGENAPLLESYSVPQPNHSNVRGMYGSATELTDETKELTISLEQSIIVTQSERITSVSSFNNSVLLVTPISANHLRLFGKQEGVTQLTIDDVKGQSRTVTVTVSRDVSDIERLIKRFWPTADVTVVPIDSAILLRGTAENEEDIKEIAEVVDVKAAAVINQLRVGPSAYWKEKLKQHIEVHVENGTVSTTLAAISQAAAVNIVVDEKSFNNAGRRSNEPASLDLSGVSLRAVLDLLTKGEQLSWSIEKDVIMIRALPVGQPLDAEMSALEELVVPPPSTVESTLQTSPRDRIVTLECSGNFLKDLHVGSTVQVDWIGDGTSSHIDPVDSLIICTLPRIDQNAKPDAVYRIKVAGTQDQINRITSALTAGARPVLRRQQDSFAPASTATADDNFIRPEPSPAEVTSNTQNENSRESLRADIRALHADVRELIKLLKEEKSPAVPPKEEKTADVLPADGSPVALYFRAGWCGPCQLMEKSIKGLPESGTPLVTIDIDERPELARRFQIDRIPTVIRVVEGAETDRKSGIMSADELRNLLSPDQRTVATPTAAIIRVTSKNGSLDIGSGFFVRDDLNRIRIVTVAHLLRDSGKEPEIRVSVPKSHTLFSARIVDQDVKADVAVLEPVDDIDLEKLVTPAPLRTRHFQVGEPITVHGFPLDAHADLTTPTVIAGKIKSTDRYEGPTNFEIDGVEAVQGMSGAMVLDSHGKLCGVVIAVDKQEKCTVCTGAPAVRVLNRSQVMLSPGWGNLKQVPPMAVELKDTNFRGGLRITEIIPGGPAEKAGIREGDILVGLHVYETLSHSNVMYVLEQYDFESEDGLKFYLLRNGETVYGNLKLAPHPPFDEWVQRLNAPEAPLPFGLTR